MLSWLNGRKENCFLDCSLRKSLTLPKAIEFINKHLVPIYLTSFLMTSSVIPICGHVFISRLKWMNDFIAKPHYYSFSTKRVYFIICSFYFLFCYVYVCISVCICLDIECWCHWEPEEGVGSPGARVAGSCELPYVAVVKLVRVLSKSSMHS